MKKNSLMLFMGLFGLLFAFSNCASLTGFHDGRTVGQSNGEVAVSLNFASTPDFNDWEDQSDTATSIPNLYFPNIEFSGRYGVSEKLDVTLRLNTTLNLGIGAKYQIVGDRESEVALALGAEVGTFGLFIGLWNVQVPLYFSVHPKENFAWYLTPRFIYQFSSFAGADTGLTYAGGNTGLLFGKRHKFGLDFGYYRAGTDGESIGIVQFGLGGRFLIGNN